MQRTLYVISRLELRSSFSCTKQSDILSNMMPEFSPLPVISTLTTLSQEGNTPLMYAASVGHSDIIVFLAEKGAKLEEKNEVGVY
jgi:ankyrin repeat protein